jgi:hypothetical protein
MRSPRATKLHRVRVFRFYGGLVVDGVYGMPWDAMGCRGIGYPRSVCPVSH